MLKEAWLESQRILKIREQTNRFAKYANDPVGFATQVLGDHFTEDTLRVIESVRDNPVTIAKSGNAVGKTFTAARIAVWFFLVFPESQVYLVAAPPLDNLKRILWGELSSIVVKHPHLFDGYRSKSLAIIRSGDLKDTKASLIAGLTIPTSGSEKEREAKFSGKHPPHLLFIVDEGDAVPDEVYSGMETCMSGGHSRMLVMFNPRSSTGPVYMKELNNQANVVHLSALNHPNVLTGKDVIPGAVTREVTLRRINEWTRPMIEGENKDMDTFEVPDYLVGQTTVSASGIPYPPLPAGFRKITEPSFAYVVMGEYPAQAVTQLINIAWINAARVRYDNYVKLHGEIPPASILPIMGLDIAEYGADWNCAFFRWGSYVAKPILWQGLDTTQSAAHALNLYLNHNANIVMVDGTGVGSGVAPAISRAGRQQNVRAISVKAANSPSPLVKSDLGEFKSVRDQMWWSLREWLKSDPDAMLPPDLALMEELKTPTYEIKNGKIVIMDKPSMRQMLHRSPDRADALCLTFAPYNRCVVVRMDGSITKTTIGGGIAYD